MYPEDDLLPISALNQLVYCPRRCALMHTEGVWADNRYTAEGTVFHEHVHEQDSETRGHVRIARGVALRSLELGLVGIADVVEFHRVDDAGPGVAIPGAPGLWQSFPIEYKLGKPKPDRSDEVQLCAQALCLEEMLGADIPAGAVFYGRTRRRHDVALGTGLREATRRAAGQLHALLGTGITPPPQPGPKCRKCSLADACLPNAGASSVQEYLRDVLGLPGGDDP